MVTLVYNRSASDFYNVSDINQVEDAIQDMYQKVKAMGYSPTVKGRKKWRNTDIPRQSAIDAIRSSIINIGSSFLDITDKRYGWRSFSVGSKTIDAYELNAWEWDLQIISDAVDAIISDSVFRQANTMFMYSGGGF